MADRALAVTLLRAQVPPSIVLVAERKAGLAAARRAKRLAMGRQRYFDRPAVRAARMRAAAAREAAFHAQVPRYTARMSTIGHAPFPQPYNAEFHRAALRTAALLLQMAKDDLATLRLQLEVAIVLAQD